MTTIKVWILKEDLSKVQSNDHPGLYWTFPPKDQHYEDLVELTVPLEKVNAWKVPQKNIKQRLLD